MPFEESYLGSVGGTISQLGYQAGERMETMGVIPNRDSKMQKGLQYVNPYIGISAYTKPFIANRMMRMGGALLKGQGLIGDSKLGSALSVPRPLSSILPTKNTKYTSGGAPMFLLSSAMGADFKTSAVMGMGWGALNKWGAHISGGKYSNVLGLLDRVAPNVASNINTMFNPNATTAQLSKVGGSLRDFIGKVFSPSEAAMTGKATTAGIKTGSKIVGSVGVGLSTLMWGSMALNVGKMAVTGVQQGITAADLALRKLAQNDFGSGQATNNRLAQTERQMAIKRIQDAQLGVRSVLGNEAGMMHSL